MKSTFICLDAIASHQKTHVGQRLASSKYGRMYTRGYKMFANGGWGLSTYSTKKDRRVKVRALGETRNAAPHPQGPMSQATKVLSPHWRPFALDDGGVLFTHPNQKQVLMWTQSTLKKEREATQTTGMDNLVNAKIQSLIAENTIENVSLSHWRRQHIWRLLKGKARTKSNIGIAGGLAGRLSD